MAMREDIYKSLNAKTTNELNNILEKNDKSEYTDLAFETIKEILNDRDSIYKKYNSKTTRELQNIIDENNKERYSKTDFKIIEQILLTRKPKIHTEDTTKSRSKNENESFEKNNESEGGFWAFDKMISIMFIKIIYIIGMIALTFGGLALGIWSLADSYDVAIFVPIGFGCFSVGNIIWRIMCENIIIFYKIFEKLNQIEQKI